MPTALAPSAHAHAHANANASVSAAGSNNDRQNILLLGLRRSGKSSLVSYLYKQLPANDTLFIDSTARPSYLDLDIWTKVKVWDTPGLAVGAEGSGSSAQVLHAQQQGTSNAGGDASKGNAGWQGFAAGTAGQLRWTQTGAVVWVIDAQDDLIDSVSRLHGILIEAYAHNPEIQFHIFVHKVDGLSDDYRDDTEHDVKQRVYDNLADASASFTFAPSGIDILQSPTVDLAAMEGSAEPGEGTDVLSAEATAKNVAGVTSMTNSIDALGSAGGDASGFGSTKEMTGSGSGKHATGTATPSGFSSPHPGQSAFRAAGGSEHVASAIDARGALDESRKAQAIPPALMGAISLDTDVKLSFHITSIFDTSANIAFSKVQMGLVQPSVVETLEDLCDHLCSSCKLEKASIFDVPSRTFVCTDTGPSDGNTFDVTSDYLDFLLRFTKLYSNLRPAENAEMGSSQLPRASVGAKQSSSSVRLSNDTTIIFSQLNGHLGLLAVLRTDVHSKHAGMIGFNIDHFRKAIVELYELSQGRVPPE
ncbi:hypothetical protein IE81DRAFT_323498 [Ceraceosorus guamensis]|uniref:GTP-binding protein n=1 Tax=Ceraceosorus guamensis TaxID=1522189 RepID=A0A316VZP6_9BASI|nr:hypothetical protein IE81DRAFT_323498 [Ceraceosorus guamensis]PWN42348.1 hypothetical protein IE81DRAFT_323498 [Ceraceosorus guamensis]